MGEKNAQKTICITSFHSIISRNILQTPIVSELVAAGHRVVLLVPDDKERYFREYYGTQVAEIVGIPFQKKNGSELMRLISISTIGIENLYIRRLQSENRFGKLAIAYIAHYILGRFFLFKSFLRYISRTFFVDTEVAPVLKNINPDLVFSTDIYLGGDREVLRAAKSLGIKTVGMVRSWDNVTTKGVLFVEPDQLLVHNKILKSELIEHNRISEDKIHVTGIPHYDTYGKQPKLTREAFCAKMNLNPQKKIILFAPGGNILYTDDALLLRLFKSIMDEHLLPHDVQFLVRLPPNDTIDSSDVAGDDRFVIDTPGVDVGTGKKGDELSPNDEEHLKNSLYHSDVLVTLASTMIIDAAAFDLPTIMLGFNPKGNQDEIKKFARYSHLQKLLGMNLCTVVESKDEFVQNLNTYLTDAATDSDKRSAIANAYGHDAQGGASKRVATFLLKELL